VRHTTSHDNHQFRLREFWKEGTDGERSFGLAHKNAGGNIEGFRAAGAHHASHCPRGSANDELHNAEVIEHSEEGGNEDDRG